ncbi:hypothetical protein [Terasakiella sp. SH-1]|uniref:hypothetical protein n=1 Tax=Terasakiella sp. SH-1 TaxID=2560057 RepID=UPI001073F9A2|nr:hypothetical protein [Terasakiella sp. SH-1]
MVTEIAVAQQTQLSVSVSYSRKTETTITKEEGGPRDYKDLIEEEFNDLEATKEKLKNASSPEEMISLLKEGQEQAMRAVEKFKAVANKFFGTDDQTKADYFQDLLFQAVSDAVGDVLTIQTKTTEEIEINISFESRVAIAMRERDPELMDQLEGKLREEA